MTSAQTSLQQAMQVYLRVQQLKPKKIKMLMLVKDGEVEEKKLPKFPFLSRYWNSKNIFLLIAVYSNICMYI